MKCASIPSENASVINTVIQKNMDAEEGVAVRKNGEWTVDRRTNNRIGHRK